MRIFVNDFLQIGYFYYFKVFKRKIKQKQI